MGADESRTRSVPDRIQELEASLAARERETRELARALDQARREREPPVLVGRSASAQRILRFVERAAGTSYPVLLEGEVGTGKRLVARAIHQASPRRDGPLVTLEATRFDPEALARAAGGTLVVAHADALPPELVPRLSGLLAASPAGDGPGARIIATLEVSAGEATRLPGELEAPLAVLKLRLPPLRERLGDLPDLLALFLSRSAPGERGPDTASLEPSALAALERHGWPENLRELEAAARFFSEEGGPVTGALVARFLGSRSSEGRVPGAPGTRALLDAATGGTLREVERAVISARLARCAWQKTHAARSLGIDRKTLYRKIRELGLVEPNTAPVRPEEPR